MELGMLKAWCIKWICFIIWDIMPTEEILMPKCFASFLAFQTYQAINRGIKPLICSLLTQSEHSLHVFHLSEIESWDRQGIRSSLENHSHVLLTSILCNNTCSTVSNCLQHWHLETKVIPFLCITQSKGSHPLSNLHNKMEMVEDMKVLHQCEYTGFTGFMSLTKFLAVAVPNFPSFVCF